MLNFPPAIIRWLDLLRTTQLGTTRGRFHEKIDGEDCYCALGFLCLANGQPPRDKDFVNNWDYVNEVLGSNATVCSVYAQWDGWNGIRPTKSEFADWLERFLAPLFPVTEPGAT